MNPNTVHQIGTEISWIYARMMRDMIMLRRLWEALRDHAKGEEIPAFADLVAVPKFEDIDIEQMNVEGWFSPPEQSRKRKPPTKDSAFTQDWSGVDMKLWPRSVLVKRAHELGFDENDTRGQSVQALRDMIEKKLSIPEAVPKKPVIAPKKPGQLKLPTATNAVPFRLPRPRLG